jgi:hypothetical protein
VNKTQKNIKIVLERIINASLDDPEYAQYMAVELENMLQDLHVNDFFGTEGECDPRGDFRNGNWTMKKVEQ